MLISAVLQLFGKVSVRLPAVVILATALASLAVGSFSYFESAEEIRHQETDKLVALGVSRHAALTQYFRSIEEDLELLARSTEVADALAGFRTVFGGIDQSDRAAEEDALRRIYSPDNTSGDRSAVASTDARTLFDYFHVHNKHHDWFESVQRLKGFYDLFLISPTGDVIYSVAKEQDFASNLFTGPWSDSGLSAAVRGALKGDVTFVDYAPYGPSNNDPAAFIARAIKNGNRTVGALALQMPAGRINEVMQVTAGMGETGETYIVGSDKLMRSDSRFSDQSTILKTRVDTVASNRALAGETGVDIVDDYTGTPVLSAYQPFSSLGVNWALLAEIDVAEIEQPVDALRSSIMYIGAGLVLLVALGGIGVARSITEPLGRLRQSIREFRQTRLPVDLTGFSGDDEISEIARGFDATTKEIAEYIARINEARDELVQNQEEIRSLIDVSPIGFILTRFEGDILMTNASLRDTLGWPDSMDMMPDASEIYEDPEDRRRYVELLQRDGEVSQFETVMLRRDNTPVWVTLSSRVIDYGNAPAILAWIDDVSERKKSEQEIAEKEAILRLSFDTMADGIYVLDHNLDYSFFNTQYLEMTSLPEGTIAVGASVEHAIRAHAERGDYGPGDIEEKIVERLTALQGPDFVQTDLLIDHGARILDIRKASLSRGGAVVVMTDVTERRKAERELAAEQARINAIMESVPDGIITIDVDGTIKSVNKAVEAIFGYAPSELIGRNVKMLMDEEMQGIHDAHVKAYVDTGEARFIGQAPRELPAMNKDGHSIPIELSLGEAAVGEERIFIGVIRDVSLRKQAEAQLKIAMENMPGALWVVGPDLRLVLANDQYTDFYGDVNGIVKPGTLVEDIIRQEAQAGLLGDDGDVGAIVEERLASFRSGEVSTFDDTALDGRHLRLLRRSTDDGYVVSVVTDISEQKKAEEAVEEQRAQLDEILANISQGVVKWDKDKKLSHWNNVWPDMLQVRDEMLHTGTHLYDFTLDLAERGFYGEGDPKDIADSRVAALWKGETRADVSFGDERSFFAQSTKSPDGGLLITFTDISDRKESERALRQSEETSRRIISSAPDPLVIVSPDAKIQITNDQVTQVFGYSQEELSGAPIETLIPEEIRASHVESRDRFIANPTNRQMGTGLDLAAQTKDGQVFPVEVSLSPIPVRDETWIAASIRDVSERKNHEIELREQRDRFLSVLENSAMGISIIDPSNNERLFVNSALLKLFGCATEEEYCNIPVGLLWANPEDFHALRAGEGSDFVRSAEVQRLRKDGSKWWCSTTRQKLYFDGRDALIVWYQDVTDRKEAERILKNAMTLINESIEYASRIQRSVLPPDHVLNEAFADHVTIWEPRDVVGGDIYLHRDCDGGHLLCLMDCTGHGVPGAFMTMIATGALDQALQEHPDGDPATLLARLNQLVKRILGQDRDDGESDDGLECGLCRIGAAGDVITYAGARFELWTIDGGKISVTKGDRAGIGYRRSKMDFTFTNTEIPVSETAAYYMISDGFFDQVGGAKSRAFGKRRLKNVMLDYSRMALPKQGVHILREFTDYQHDQVRRDDISMVGFKVRSGTA